VTSDPFQTFGIEARFDLDLDALERSHRELSRALHPDRHAGEPPAERRRALSMAIEVNEAWRTLRDPISRAEAVLARFGVMPSEGQEPKPDPELLMEMMEKREALAEVRRSKDEAALGRLADEIRQRQAQAERALAQLLNDAGVVPAEPPDAPPDWDVAAALRHLGELRYTRRFLDEAASIEDELF
jgi:molecular chaperone HscB